VIFFHVVYTTVAPLVGGSCYDTCQN